MKFNLKLIIWIILILLIIIYAIPLYLTYSPKSCVSCHSMEKYYSSWKKSDHDVAASNCLYCHVRPGVFNLILYRIAFWKEIYAEITGKEIKPAFTSLPSTENCSRIGCHSLNRVTSRSGDIKIEHRLHVKQAKIQCPTCHPGAVHIGITGEAIPPRKLCKRCHQERMSECSMCHTREFPIDVEFEH